MGNSARVFWTDLINKAISRCSDKQLTELAEAFTERSGMIFVLEVENSVNKASALGATVKLGRVDLTVLELSEKPVKAKKRSKS